MKRPRTSATGFTRTSHTPWSSLDSNTSANVAPPPRGTGGVEATQRSSIRQGQRQASPAPDSVPLCRSTTTMPESTAALVLFRLGDRGYASPRDRLLEVVDVGAGQPTVPGLEPSDLAALKGTQRLLPLISLRVALGLPNRGPGGRILVVTTRHGPLGFLVDEVVRVLEIDPAATRLRENRLGSGYVVGTVEALGATWMLVDWDAIRLPAGLRSPR